MSVRYRDELESLAADEPEFEQEGGFTQAAGPDAELRPFTGPTHGPYDEDDVDPRVIGAAERLDFGSVRVSVPPGGEVAVEPTNKGRLDAVHITVPGGRLSVSVLAAPRSAGLWKDLCAEIEQSLRAGGAQVRTEYGEWGRELHARTQEVASVFIGIDGERWMVYGVAAGPAAGLGVLDDQLRQMLRGMIVARGKSPYPPRTVLPLTLPPGLRADDEAAAAPRKATLTLRTRAVTPVESPEDEQPAAAEQADAWATTVIPRVLATPHPDAAGQARPEQAGERAAARQARPEQPSDGRPRRAPLPQRSQATPLPDGGPETSVLPPYRAPAHPAAPGNAVPGATGPWPVEAPAAAVRPAPARPEPVQRPAAQRPQPAVLPDQVPQVAAPAPYTRPMPVTPAAQGPALPPAGPPNGRPVPPNGQPVSVFEPFGTPAPAFGPAGPVSGGRPSAQGVGHPAPGPRTAADSGRLLGERRQRPAEDILGQGPVVVPDDEAPTMLYDELMAEVREATSRPVNGSRRAAPADPAGRVSPDRVSSAGRVPPAGRVNPAGRADEPATGGRRRGAHRAPEAMSPSGRHYRPDALPGAGPAPVARPASPQVRPAVPGAEQPGAAGEPTAFVPRYEDGYGPLGPGQHTGPNPLADGEGATGRHRRPER